MRGITGKCLMKDKHKNHIDKICALENDFHCH